MVTAEEPRGKRQMSMALQISADGRRIERADGADWFWLGDTAWDLFVRLTREETELYFAKRQEQGFTAIEAVALMGYHLAWNAPNAYDHRPCVAGDPTRPDTNGRENYWTHVDQVIDAAARHGLHIALLPVWGTFLDGQNGAEVPFDEENAVVYARWIAERYQDRPNIVWVNGGDIRGDSRPVIEDLIGEAIKEVCPHQLMTYHPRGESDSGMWFHNREWLDFNMFQSGHSRLGNRTDAFVDRDWRRQPAKPVLDGEPCYEKHPVNWKPDTGTFDDQDVRQAAYWSLFAGACGHTYGHVNVWCFNAPGEMPPQTMTVAMDHGLHWRDELDSAGAHQMTHVRNLMGSRPQAGRAPVQDLLVGEGSGEGRLRATQGNGYAFAYASLGGLIGVDLGRLPWNEHTCWWNNPRTGEATRADQLSSTFTPPGVPERGNDWVLVVDDRSKHYPPPGQLPETL
jgi:hypothetical protein